MLVGKRIKPTFAVILLVANKKNNITSEENVALHLTSKDVDVRRLTTDKVVTGFVWHGGPSLRQGKKNRSEVPTSQTTATSLQSFRRADVIKAFLTPTRRIFNRHVTRNEVWFTTARNI